MSTLIPVLSPNGPLHDTQEHVNISLVDERQQMRIFVSGTAKRSVVEFAARYDMTEQAVASRLYTWFGTLPAPVQKWVVGLFEGNEGDGMKLFAQSLIAKTKLVPEEFDKRLGTMAASANPPAGPIEGGNPKRDKSRRR